MMGDLRKAISNWLKRKEKEEKQPVMEMRKKQGEGGWMADIGLESSEQEQQRQIKEEEEKQKKRIKK